jgi:hypothetical protein
MNVDPADSSAVTAAVTAAYEAALPADPRVERKKMFGLPCAFVNRQMFFGTFEATVVARVGPDRVRALASQPGMGMFTPRADRPWHDYVQVDVRVAGAALPALALEALAWTSKLPAKAVRPKPTKAEKAAKQRAAKQKAKALRTQSEEIED